MTNALLREAFALLTAPQFATCQCSHCRASRDLAGRIQMELTWCELSAAEAAKDLQGAVTETGDGPAPSGVAR